MANLLKGKDVALAINEKSLALLNDLQARNITPTLAILRVGEKDADISYEKNATKKALELGIKVNNVILDENVSKEDFYLKIDELNNDKSINGILMLRPLPEHLDNQKARLSIAASKDIDGCSNESLAGIYTNTKVGYAPCTAQAVIEILDYYKIDVTGKNVVIIGRSLVIGKPVSMLLLNKNATVTICHTKTKDIENICKKADIVVAASGQMESLNANYFNNKQTVIDVGISYNEQKQKLCGDVLFEEVEPIVENITPVPGGVGSITTAILLNHVIDACNKQNS